MPLKRFFKINPKIYKGKQTKNENEVIEIMLPTYLDFVENFKEKNLNIWANITKIV